MKEILSQKWIMADNAASDKMIIKNLMMTSYFHLSTCDILSAINEGFIFKDFILPVSFLFFLFFP